MKLKKIASLMLAGVMAVSMLAGCSDKGGASSEDQDKEPTGVTVEAINAALDNDIKVKFTASSALENALDKAIDYVGIKGASKIDAADLNKFDTNLKLDDSSAAELQLNDKKNETDEKVEKDKATAAEIVIFTDDGVANESYVVKQIVDKMLSNGYVSENFTTIKNLPAQGSKNYSDAEGDGKHFYAFSYTGEMAIGSVVNYDKGYPVTTYVVVYTVTRTATSTPVQTAG